MSLMSYSKCFPLSRALFHNFHCVSLNLKVYVLLPMQGICGTKIYFNDLTYYYRYIPILGRYMTASFFDRYSFDASVCNLIHLFMNLFLLSQCASVHRILGRKCGMEPGTSVPLAGFMIIEDPLIFLFSPLRFLGCTEPRGKSSQQEKHLPFQS